MGQPTEKEESGDTNDGIVGPSAEDDENILLDSNAKALRQPDTDSDITPTNNNRPTTSSDQSTTIGPPIGSIKDDDDDEESCVSDLTVESVSTLMGRRHWYPGAGDLSLLPTIPDEMTFTEEEASSSHRPPSSSTSHLEPTLPARAAAAAAVPLNRATDLLSRDDIKKMESSTRGDPLLVSSPTINASPTAANNSPTETTTPGAFPVTGIGGYAPGRTAIGVALVSSVGGTTTTTTTNERGDDDDDGNVITATPVEDNSAARRDDLVEAQPMDMDAVERKKAERKRSLYFAMACFVLALVTVVVVAVLIRTSANSKNTADSGQYYPSMAPSPAASHQSQSPTSVVDMLLPNLPQYTIEALEDSASPQSKALNWLSTHPQLADDDNALDLEEWRKEQLFALATFYYSTDGGNWTNNTGWLDPSVNECSWFGMETFQHFGGSLTYYDTSNRNSTTGPCNEEGSYELLWLYHNGLQGTIPLELYLLTNLKAISLYGNANLGSTISSHVGRLSHLGALWVQRLKFGGTLPTQLGTLNELQTLSIVRNQFTGRIPSQLGLLSVDLETLYLDSNSLTGSIPSEVAVMSGLRSLYLGMNPSITGTLHSELGTLRNLKSTLFTGMNLTGTIPTSFGSLSNLDWLSLNRNQLTGSLPTELGMMGQLKGIWVSENELGGPIPSQFGNFVNLTHFILFENKLSGSIPSELGKASNIQTLRVSNNNFTGSLPSEFGTMKDAAVLRFHKNALGESIPSELGLLTSMKLLNLEDNNLTGFIPSELGWLALNASLEGLNVTENVGLVGTIPEALCLLPQKEASVNWVVPHMDYTCSESLCGCDNCKCGFNGTANGTSIGGDRIG